MIGLIVIIQFYLLGVIIMFKQLSNLSKVSKVSKEREDGQGLVEYALILVLVSVVVVVVLSQMGPAVGNIFSGVVGALNGGVVAGEEEEEEDIIFSGTITSSDANDGGGRNYDSCGFTVSETGTYSVTDLSTDKSSNFWVTAGPGTLPASGFTIETSKSGGIAASATLDAGTTYYARPHSVTPADYPVSYEFKITGAGKATGSC